MKNHPTRCCVTPLALRKQLNTTAGQIAQIQMNAKGSGHEKKNRINHLKNSRDDLFVPCMFGMGN